MDNNIVVQKISNMNLADLTLNSSISEFKVKKISKNIFILKHLTTDKKYIGKFFGKKPFEKELFISHYLSSLDSEFFIKYYRVMEINTKNMIVMDYFEGKNILKFIKHYKDKITNEILLVLTKLILRAVNFMHQHNIIHFDIKSENILILMDNDKINIKIIDFGYSDYNNVFPHGGSLFFLSPEIIMMKDSNNRINSHIDYKKSDIWAMGILFYELCNFVLPWDYKLSDTEIIESILNKDIKSPFSTNETMHNIINDCLTIDHSVRPDTCDILKKYFSE